MKVIRTLYFFFLTLVLILCLLFALLQTRWLKEKMAEFLKTASAQKGILLEVGTVKGVFPFSLQIDHLSCSLPSQTLVTCEKIKVRLSLFSLLKGKLFFSYIDVKEAAVSFSHLTGPDKERAEFSFTLPQNLAVRRFKVHRLSCENRLTQQSGTYTLEMQAELGKKLTHFSFDTRLSPYAIPQEALQVTAVGNQKRNSTSVQVKARLSSLAFLSPFYVFPKVEEINGECILRGSWASFDAFIHRRQMLTPLTLISHIQLRPTGISAPFNRLWKIDLKSAIDTYHTYSINRLQLHSDLLTLQADGTIENTLEASRFNAQFTFPDFTIFNDKLQGALEGQLQLAHSHISLTMKSPAITLGHFPPQKIAARIEAHPAHNGWEGDLSCSLPASGHLSFYIVPFSSLSLSDLSFTSDSFFASGAMQLDLTQKLLTGDIYAHVRDTGSGTLRFSHEEGRQTLDSFLLGEGFSATFKASEEAPGEYPFFFDIKKQELQCTLQGLFTSDEKSMTLETTHLEGTYLSYPFTLNMPCILEKGPQGASLSPLDMQIGEGKLSASCDLNPVRSTGTVALSHFPLEWLQTLYPQRVVSGSLTANLFFDATPDNLQGALNATLEEAYFTHMDRPDPLMIKGSLQAHADRNILQTHLHLLASQEQGCEASATLPLAYQLYPFKLCLNRTGNLSAECAVEARIEDLLDFIHFGTHQFTGLLDGRFLLAGSVETPIVQGELFWEEGSYDNILTGTVLKNVHAELQAEKDQIRLVAFSADDTRKGTMNAEGSLDLDSAHAFPYRLTAQLEELHTLHFNPLDCTLTGSLYIQGIKREATAQGNLLVDKALYTLQGARTSEIPSLPVTLLHIPGAPSEAVIAIKSFPLHLDLDLTAEEHIMVQGKGLQSEWKGTLHLTGTNMNVRVDGVLDLVKGDYDLFGKTFKLTEGQILFSDKPGAAAQIHLTGALSLPEATITAHLRGPLASPTLTLQSNPQMSTSAILARVLFNKDISDISQPEALQLATALISLSGGAGPSVLETIRKNLGVDRLSITSQTNNPDEIAVQIGKYLTKGIMVTLSQSATSSQIIIEVEFKHGFVFRAETQEVEEGKFSLKWTHSY